jgi:biopolymer transport protein ExbD
VRGDDDVDFEYVADVIDIAREAGVDHVGLTDKRAMTSGRLPWQALSGGIS